MTNQLPQTPQTPMAVLSGTTVTAISRAIPLIKAAVLAVSVAAAIPTASNLYYSWKTGIPFAQVPHRLAQYDLWMKNLECKIDYRAISTANNSKVDVGACSKTGDIAIKVSSATGHATTEWIPLDRLKPAMQAMHFMDLLISPAHAEIVTNPSTTVKAPIPVGTIQLAQAAGPATAMEVMCEARKGDKISRVVKDGGKCFRETWSPMKGSMDKREEVACTTKCD
jgi:hypothetical protein